MTAEWERFFNHLYDGQAGVLELRALRSGDGAPVERDFIPLKDGRIDPARVQSFVNTCVRIPVHREHSFRFKVNADSADAEQRFRSS